MGGQRHTPEQDRCTLTPTPPRVRTMGRGECAPAPAPSSRRGSCWRTSWKPAAAYVARTSRAWWSSRPDSTAMPPGRSARRMCGRQLDQRTGQDVGEHQVEGLRAAQHGMVEARRVEDAHAAGDAVEPRVGARHGGGERIVVDGEHARAGKCARRGDRQHARAAAQIDHAPEASPPCQQVDGLQAQGGRGVVAGAERLAGLDLDGSAPQPQSAGGRGCRARRSGRRRPAATPLCDSATQFSSGTASSDGVPSLAASPASASAIASSAGSAS